MLTGYIEAMPGFWFKQGRLTGRIALKNAYWYMVFNFVNGSGKPRPKWEATQLPERNNKTRANQMLKERLGAFNSKAVSDSENSMMMPELTRLWLEAKNLEIESNSYVSYRDIANLHVIPYFEKLGKPIQELTGNDIHLYYTTKRQEGLTVLEKHRTVIRSSLGFAIVPLGILKVNPTDGVKLPERKGSKTETKKYYSVEELHALFEAIKGEVLEAPVRLAATCGLSRSEALGLCWDVVNFEHNTITILRATVRVESGTEHKDRLKEKARFRTMPMPRSLRTYLEALYRHQQKMKELLGDAYEDNNFICKWDDGRPMAPDYVSQRFHNLLKKKGLRHITFHQLRHTAASLLVQNGHTLEEVQVWLGHSSRRSTEIYAHLQCGTKQNMANTMNGLLPTA